MVSHHQTTISLRTVYLELPIPSIMAEQIQGFVLFVGNGFLRSKTWSCWSKHWLNWSKPMKHNLQLHCSSQGSQSSCTATRSQQSPHQLVTIHLSGPTLTSQQDPCCISCKSLDWHASPDSSTKKWKAPVLPIHSRWRHWLLSRILSPNDP